MTGNFSALTEGSTLIKDHKKAVDALNDVATADTVTGAKLVALKALQELGELPAQSVHDEPTAQSVGPLTTRGNE